MLSRDEKLKRLKKACKLGRQDFDTLIQECRDGRSQFWDIDNACAVTTLDVSGPEKVCYITVVAGTLGGMKAMAKVIDTWAAQQDCDWIRTGGRLGFKDKQPEIDPEYKPYAIMYEKAVKK